ncbi:hypothetical protein [Paenibacillus motobuensis]
MTDRRHEGDGCHGVDIGGDGPARICGAERIRQGRVGGSTTASL